MGRVGAQLAFLGVCAVAACAGGAHGAAVSYWNQPEGGAFSDGANWLDQAVPGFADEAHFRIGGAYTVNFSIGVVNSRAVFTNDHVVFVLNGSNYTVTGDENAAALIATSVGDDTSLTVRGGRFEATDVLIGGEKGSVGALVVEGTLGRFSPFRKVVIGERGDGSLTLRDGARMTMVGAGGGVSVALAPGSTGLVRVEGGASRFTTTSPLVVGEGGAGRFETLGGAIATTSHATIGGAQGGTGEALVRGGASRWTVDGDLDIGRYGGTGALALEEGATVEATTVRLGVNGALSGRGVVRGDVFSEGLISVDASAGLTIDGALTLEHASTLRATLHDAGSDAAALSITGVATLGGALDVVFSAGAGARGTVFDVLVAAGGVFEEFDTFTFAGLGGGLSAQVVYEADRVRVAVVPAPGGAALALVAAGMGVRRRRGV